MKSIFATICAAVFAMPLFADPVQIVPGDYECTFTITFPGYTSSETLADFPVLIRLSKNLNDFRYKKCKAPAGGDLRFADADGNLLSSEVDTWDENGTSLVWVKVPSLNASTVIKAYYGNANPPAVNPRDVWSNGYIGVWHLGESARPLADSTAHGLNFTESCNISGKDAGYFDDRIEFASSGIVGSSVAFDKGTAGDHKGGLFAYDTEQTRMDGFAAATLEFWSYEREEIPSDGKDRYLIAKYTGSTAFAYMVTEQHSDHRYASQLRRVNDTNFSVNPNSSGVRTLNEWTHSVYVYDSVNIHGYYYMNGVKRTNGTYSPDQPVTTIDVPLCLGNRDSNSQYAFPGSFDELRLSSVARSADWIKATHDTVVNEDFAYYEQENDWTRYARKVVISFPGAPEAPLTDFPVLVKLSEAGIEGFSYGDFAKENGGDIRFADEDGNLLAHEVDTWDENGVSTVWVKVPTLNSSTKITAYYGWVFAPAVNSKDVWSNGYVGVWHLGESARPLLNSTATTGVDFTRSNNSASDPGHYDDCIGFAESGAAGKAVRFSAYTGEDEAMQRRGGLIAYDDENKLCGFNAISLEIWAKVEEYDTSAARYLLARRVNGGNKLRPYNIYYASNKKACSQIGLDNGLDDNNASVSHASAVMADSLVGSWNFHCFQYDNTATYHTNYLNGAYSDRKSNNTGYSVLAPSTSFICLGNDAQPSSCYTQAPASPQVFNGSVDEFRISNVVRSDAWVKATYDTIKDDSFAVYGAAKEIVNKRFSVIIR